MRVGVASYSQLFGDEERRDERLDAIGLEARERGINAFDLDDFSSLAETRSALKELTGDVQDPSHPLAVLLFHAFHFHRGGARLMETSEVQLRALIDRRPDKGWVPSSEPVSGYVRLPARYADVLGGEGDHPAWLGGFYYVIGGERLTVLAELYTTPKDFSVLPLPALPSAMIGLWAREHVRKGGGDFTDPSGSGDDGRLHIAMAAEILKLATLIVWFGEAGVRTKSGSQGPSDEAGESNA